MEKLIVANWKMNGSLKKVNSDLSYYINTTQTNKAHVVLALPYLYLILVKRMIINEKAFLKIAAQDISPYPDCGAHTGEINGTMLLDAAVDYVIIGHSERRTLVGENNAILASKVKNAIKSNLIPIFCVGDSLANREDKTYLQFIDSQLAILHNIEGLKEIVIAYEPCFAIGTGKVPTIAEIAEVVEFLHCYMQKMFAYAKITVLYGGSVTGNNAKEILGIPGVGGVLVGGASLKVTDFTAICENA